MVSPLLKTAVFSVLVPGTVAGLVPRVLARYDRRSPTLERRSVRTVGYALLVSGIVLYLHTAGRFVTEGSGTPSPSDEPPELVTGGVYAYSRNPMYLGVVLAIGGQAVRYKSLHVLWWGVVCWLGFHRRVLEYEEPHLADKHGEAYEEYCERVPRWFPGPGRLGATPIAGRDPPLDSPSSETEFEGE
ncbi:methyltransferase family protein [Halostagnicola bangensis]